MPQITIHGAAGTVTGSCHLLEAAGRRVLLECGLVQGSPADEARNREPFPFDPASLDAVILSHAHLDHSGRLPRLLREGFSGPIYVHRAGRDIADILLQDAAALAARDADYATRKRQRINGDAVAPLYSMEDVADCVASMVPLEYGRLYELFPGFLLQLHDAGHILGSAVVEIRSRENGAERRLLFTGDLGHRGRSLMNDWQKPAAADLVLMESTYGDREHRSREETLREIGDVLREAADSGGNILIPSFAVGRSQEIIYLLLRHYRDWNLQGWRIFLDSPLAIRATGAYVRHARYCRPEAADWIRQTRFQAPQLHYLETAEQSMSLNRIQSGAIIIAGSGMCTGGRIRHHFRHQLGHSATHVMIMGFQAAGTPGRALVDGAQALTIWGEPVRVAARIHTIGGISAHADRRELAEWYSGLPLPAPVVLVHGEETARQELAGYLRERFTASVSLPGMHEVIQY